jgi:hypothetical protein
LEVGEVNQKGFRLRFTDVPMLNGGTVAEVIVEVAP